MKKLILILLLGVCFTQTYEDSIILKDGIELNLEKQSNLPYKSHREEIKKIIATSNPSLFWRYNYKYLKRIESTLLPKKYEWDGGKATASPDGKCYDLSLSFYEGNKIYGCDGVFKRKWSLHESCSKGYIAVPIGKQVRDGIFYGGDAIECIPIDDASNQKSNLRIIINTEDSTIVNIRLDLVRDDGLFFEEIEPIIKFEDSWTTEPIFNWWGVSGEVLPHPGYGGVFPVVIAEFIDIPFGKYTIKVCSDNGGYQNIKKDVWISKWVDRKSEKEFGESKIILLPKL